MIKRLANVIYGLCVLASLAGIGITIYALHDLRSPLDAANVFTAFIFIVVPYAFGAVTRYILVGSKPKPAPDEDNWYR
jgi:hypothetical protein